MALIAVLSGGAVAHAAAKPPAPPAAWDAAVEPIAHEVERIRGLEFEHPIAVEYLDDAAFRERITTARASTKSERARELRNEAQLRAVGLLPAGVDLRTATDDVAGASVLAYYDTETRSVTVRGETLDAMRKQTLAHELTHALDDQHFDLDALERSARRARAESALTALVEGDAVRVEDEYTSGLSRAERDELSSREQEAGESIGGELAAVDAPAAVEVFLGSPYLLGPQMLEFLAGDNAGVDDLFRDPPRSDLAFVDPAAAGDGDAPLVVPAPMLEAGERRVGRRESFGAFALLLVLATAMDPAEALDVVSGWGGDAMVTFERGQDTCVRATFTGRDPEASTAIGDAWLRWSTNGAHPSSTVRTTGPISTVTTCDGDAPVTDPEVALVGALVTVAMRNTLQLQAVEAGLPPTVAECIADAVVRAPAFAAVRDAGVAVPGDELSPEVIEDVQRAVADAAEECASSS